MMGRLCFLLVLSCLISCAEQGQNEYEDFDELFEGFEEVELLFPVKQLSWLDSTKFVDWEMRKNGPMCTFLYKLGDSIKTKSVQVFEETDSRGKSMSLEEYYNLVKGLRDYKNEFKNTTIQIGDYDCKCFDKADKAYEACCPIISENGYHYTFIIKDITESKMEYTLSNFLISLPLP
ncbi:MAG: hypothetical protein ACI9EQ_001906 [Bacteroidia bacterium]|jgi:hypothetical protein